MAEAAHFLPARLSECRTHLRERIGHICLKGNQATGDPELRSCVKLKVEVAGDDGDMDDNNDDYVLNNNDNDHDNNNNKDDDNNKTRTKTDGPADSFAFN